MWNDTIELPPVHGILSLDITIVNDIMTVIGCQFVTTKSNVIYYCTVYYLPKTDHKSIEVLSKTLKTYESFGMKIIWIKYDNKCKPALGYMITNNIIF